MKKLILFALSAILGFAELINIDPKTLQEKIDQNITVIDIRTPPEWEMTGVIPTSKKIMFFDQRGGYDIDSWMREFSKYVKDPNQPFVLVCRSGNRTGTVGEFLSNQAGYKNVFHLQNGINSWIKENRKTQKQ